MEKFTAEEEKVAQVIQLDIPVIARPFREAGKACGMSEEEVINTTKHLLQRGYIRRFGAILRHQKVGFTRNAMVIWAVPPDQIEKTGETLAAFSCISHCYERSPAFLDKYNLFTMLHAQNDNLSAIVEKMAQSIDCHDFLILESLQEYKKISPEYFKK